MLSRILVGPLFGAILASGWWAWSLWGDGHLLPVPDTASMGAGVGGLTLMLVSLAYCIGCLLAAATDAGAFREDENEDEDTETNDDR